MNLDCAIDALYDSGWATLDTAGCSHSADGRVYPRTVRVGEEFRRAGFTLNIRKVDLFDCYRAEWNDAAGTPCGAVVGASDTEAAVFALASMRRALGRAGLRGSTSAQPA